MNPEPETGETRAVGARRPGHHRETLADQIGLDLRRHAALLERDRRLFGGTRWYRRMEEEASRG